VSRLCAEAMSTFRYRALTQRYSPHGLQNSTNPSCKAASVAGSALLVRWGIVTLSLVVGGLIASVMTALLSVSQVIG